MSTTALTPMNQRNATPTPRAASETQAMPEARTNLIRCRAYEIFLARNGEPGDPISDWIQAEREVNSTPPTPPTPPAEPRAGERHGRRPRV